MRPAAHYYDRDRRKGRMLSAIAHALFLLIAIFGLPYIAPPHPTDEPMAISVEILPISAVSNVKPSETPPAEEPKPDDSKPKPKEAPPVITKEKESVPPPPVEKPEDKKEKKPEPKKPEPKKEKPKEDDLAAVLKAVKETAKKEKKEQKPLPKTDDAASKTKSTQYNPSLPMSISEIDAVRSQIAHCWNVQAGAKDAQNLVVTLHLEVAPDGSVMKVELASENQPRYNSDNAFRAAAESAIRAVKICSPLKNLPQDKYDTWRDMEMTFDPKEMLF